MVEVYGITLRHHRKEVKLLRITMERRRKGLSQSVVARMAEVHPSTLSSLEAGKLYPYPAWKRRLGQVLGVSGDELFEKVADSAFTAGGPGDQG